MTSAMIDSRDFTAAKRWADSEVLLPAGPKIAFSGGDTTDHRDLGQTRSGPRQAPGHGAVAWRIAQGRGTHRDHLGQ